MAELTLEQQVARLTDIEDIKQMKSQYCYYADHGYDPDGMASLFVEDAIWDGGDFGRYEGKSRRSGNSSSASRTRSSSQSTR